MNNKEKNRIKLKHLTKKLEYIEGVDNTVAKMFFFVGNKDNIKDALFSIKTNIKDYFIVI